MLIDTHIHLDAPEFDQDRPELLTRARCAGVKAFILPAIKKSTFDRVAALGREHADIHCAFGIHPLFLDDADEADLQALDNRLAQSQTVAVGEIGLDLFVQNANMERQEFFFVEQLKLARKHDLPVILHIRRAQDLILKNLRRHPVRGGIAHAFNGSLQQARQFISLGFKLGFGGAMTFSGSRRIRALASILPSESLVLETDAPDIPPAWAHGGRNEPANLARFASELATLRSVDVAEIINVTGRNARTVFPTLPLPDKT